MSTRAVLRIYNSNHNGAFTATWGSPQFKMPALAGWFEACRWRNQIPTADNYREHIQANPENQFNEAIAIDAPDPDHLTYRYEIHASKAIHGWGADLSVWTNRRPDGHLSWEFELQHRLSVSNLLTGPAHALAAAGLRELIQTSRSRQHPYSDQTMETWQHRTDIHDAYANVDPTGLLVSQALTRHNLRAIR